LIAHRVVSNNAPYEHQDIANQRDFWLIWLFSICLYSRL